MATAGINSHQPGPAWIPDGTLLVALVLDGDRGYSEYDAPLIGQAEYCSFAGSAPTAWASSVWIGVEQAGRNSHAQDDPAWCPEGSFITQIDLDGASGLSSDSPVIGAVRCAGLSGYTHWAASYWVEVGRSSLARGAAWCRNGSFLTQVDLDGDSSLDAHDSPIVGRARCAYPGT